jgi:hypothetical protein
MKKKLKAVALGLNEFFEWTADRWYRVAAYWLILEIIWFCYWLGDKSLMNFVILVIVAVLGITFTAGAHREQVREKYQKQREALDQMLRQADEVMDADEWVGPGDPGYPKRPIR